MLFYHLLTFSAGIPIEANPRHRLQTLTQRRNRFVDPLSSRDIGTSFTDVHDGLPQMSRNGTPFSQPFPASHCNAQNSAPAHPFNLSSTLGRIAAANRALNSRFATGRVRRNTASERLSANIRPHRPNNLETLRPPNLEPAQTQYGRMVMDGPRRQGIGRDRHSGPVVDTARDRGGRRQVRPYSATSSGSSETVGN